ncbi:helix-turn-helix domain-containing protein [Metallumcola ferriviriculae]|uniref:Helix-turn-helix domain-containing protein n=1 Tax=Metallumcola ferriviriculae TaxID=3039180 RepID=A0AAU0USU0_9FIRM|nr:helix-turn-helix domain-containing protein [Desulfitibacteraceae bacterium MK1]
MHQLGRILKKQREIMGITVWEAQEGTKIATHYLHCMEKGDFRQIPGGQFYLKSFLKNYADYIGLDGPAVVKYYQELSGAETVRTKRERSLLSSERSGVFKAIFRTLVSFM